ncbi:hypothetical protein, partial [Haladaptatus sp. W1]|uniref:hypothetical protein n=1 Tax=Haladaptatus sp. W1 TaxID=1897478 RepID=UPI001C30BE4D
MSRWIDSNLSEEPPSDQDTHTDVEHDNRKQFRRDERDEQPGQYHSEAHPEREATAAAVSMVLVQP